MATISEMKVRGNIRKIKDAKAQEEIEKMRSEMAFGEYSPVLHFYEGLVQASDGSVVSPSTGYRYTQLIPVYEGLQCTYKSTGSSGAFVLAMYEYGQSTANLTHSIKGNSTTDQTGTVTIPAGIVYVRVCCATERIRAASIKLNNAPAETIRTDLDNKIKNGLNAGAYNPDLILREGLVTKQSGGAIVTPSPSYRCSQLIPVYEGLKCAYRTKVGVGGIALCLYETKESNADLINSIEGDGTVGQYGTIYIPSGIKYVRLCTALDYVDSAYISLDNTPVEVINDKAKNAHTGEYEVLLNFSEGLIAASSGAIVTPSPGYRYSQLIAVFEGMICEYDSKGSSGALIVAMYANNHSDAIIAKSIPGSSSETRTTGTVVIPGGVEYIRICTGTGYKKHASLKVSNYPVRNINEDLKHIRQNQAAIERLPKGGYIHERRPTIAFTMDGEYNLNAQAAQALMDHDFVGTFALQWLTEFENNSKQFYLDLQNKGFEIASHSASPIGNQSGSGTDEEVAQIIENAYKVMTEYGFDIRSLVALQGNTRASAYPIIKRYFETGFTKPNHAGTDEPLISIESDPPYELWRYSLETSSEQEIKDAVDACAENNGLLEFYWHARSDNEGCDIEKFNTILDYVASHKEIQVLTAYGAVADYYSVRLSDIN